MRSISIKQTFLTVLVLLLVGAPATRAAQCSYGFSPGSSSAPAAGGGGSFNVTTGSSCAWTAATTNGWVHPTGNGPGNGSVAYTTDANLTSSARVGAITAGGQTFVINQAGAPVPLGVALGNTNLVWLTGATNGWFGTNSPAPSFDGVNSAVSGNRYLADSTSWFRTTVVGPGTLGFWWKVDSDVTPPPPDPPYSYDYLEFMIDEESQSQIMGQVDWNYRGYNIPPGVHTLQWQYVKDAQYNAGADQAWVDQVTYTTPLSLPEALNTCGVSWSTGGNTNATFWSGQTNVSHDGKSAAQSGSIFVTQESWLQATVSGVTNLSFWWKVSSQTNYDFLELYTNNVLARRISGEVNWQSNFFRLPPATNVIKWRYAKTNFNVLAQGQNSGWIDQVAFSPNLRASPYRLSGPSHLPDGTAQIGIEGETGCNCQLQVSSDLVTWTTLSNFTLGNDSVTIADPAATSIPVRFYRTVAP